MTLRALVIAMVAGAAMLPGAAAAGNGGPPLDDFAIRVGGFASRLETSLRFDESEIYDTTVVDFDDELALEEDDVVEYVGVSSRPWPRHQFDLDYFEQELVGERRLARDIEFEGERFVIDSLVRSELGMRAIGFSYTYWAALDESWALGLRIGYTDYHLRASMGLLMGANGEPPELVAVARLDERVPVPSVGVNYHLRVLPDWRLKLRVGWLEKRMPRVSPQVITFNAGVEYLPWENLGAWVDLGINRIDVETRREDYNGALRFDEGGLRLGLTWRF